MKITIDTTLKQICIERDCTIKDLNEFLELFKINDQWTIVSKSTLDWITPNPIQPYEYLKPPYIVTCS